MVFEALYFEKFNVLFDCFAVAATFNYAAILEILAPDTVPTYNADTVLFLCLSLNLPCRKGEKATALCEKHADIWLAACPLKELL